MDEERDSSRGNSVSVGFRVFFAILLLALGISRLVVEEGSSGRIVGIVLIGIAIKHALELSSTLRRPRK